LCSFLRDEADQPHVHRDQQRRENEEYGRGPLHRRGHQEHKRHRDGSRQSLGQNASVVAGDVVNQLDRCQCGRSRVGIVAATRARQQRADDLLAKRFADLARTDLLQARGAPRGAGRDEAAAEENRELRPRRLRVLNEHALRDPCQRRPLRDRASCLESLRRRGAPQGRASRRSRGIQRRVATRPHRCVSGR
jgi:hypothetical protein